MTASESSMSMYPPNGIPRIAKPSRRWMRVIAREPLRFLQRAQGLGAARGEDPLLQD
jgi:hypothetical protein